MIFIQRYIFCFTKSKVSMAIRYCVCAAVYIFLLHLGSFACDLEKINSVPDEREYYCNFFQNLYIYIFLT